MVQHIKILCTNWQTFCKKNTLPIFFLLSPLPFIIVSEVLYRTFLQSRKKEKVIFTGNEVKISLFLDGMILYLKNHYQTQLYLGFSDVVFQEFYSFCFTVTSVINFGLNFFFFFCMQLSTYSSTIFKKLVFITVQLIYNVVSVSTLQQSESVIYMNHLSTLLDSFPT